MIAVWGDGVSVRPTCWCIPTLYHHSLFPVETTASPLGSSIKAGWWQPQGVGCRMRQATAKESGQVDEGGQGRGGGEEGENVGCGRGMQDRHGGEGVR